MTDSGFQQGQSDNLPKIDSDMMASFFCNNPDFVSAEMRGVKALKSSRESYGDNAIGYVQVKRDGGLCTVKCRVTPEHRVRNQGYSVLLICNELDEFILSCKCEDCPASEGGCKHVNAFITWLHRRSEEPPKTSVECYWKRSRMACVGSSTKILKAREFSKNPQVISKGDGSFLKEVIETSIKNGIRDKPLLKFYTEPTELEKLSLHHLMCSFLGSSVGSTSVEFLSYCGKEMLPMSCQLAANMTTDQADNKIWHDLRYARITASRIHEAAHCHTLEGSLVESILGAKLFETKAIKRGKSLESQVLAELENKISKKITKCGLLLSNEHPIFGASPDGIGDNFIVEIKCPISATTIKNYIANEKPSPKYNAQMQLQMHFSKKKRGLFCVADPAFEMNKEVTIIEVSYDQQQCTDYMEKALVFWSKAVYPFLNYK